jgi:CBS domain-containing protein
VEEHLDEQERQAGQHGRVHAREAKRRPAHRGWSRLVSDVMTTSVVTVDRITPYKEITRLLAEHRISGVPVLKMGRQVVGVVTEADLIAAQADTARRLRSAARRIRWPGARQRPALTAEELMTCPAITVGPHVTVPAAARIMSTHHLRRLPVVNEEGKLIGVVSRRDILGVFLRPDEDIARDTRVVLEEILGAGPDEAQVSVKNGIVTLSGSLDPKTGPHGDLIPLALRLLWDIDGVVDIVDRLGEEGSAPPVTLTSPTETSPPAQTPPAVRAGSRTTSRTATTSSVPKSPGSTRRRTSKSRRAPAISPSARSGAGPSMTSTVRSSGTARSAARSSSRLTPISTTSPPTTTRAS